MKFTTDELRSIAILDGLPGSHIAWLAEHGDKIELARGEHMFECGQPADFMFIVVKGAIEGYENVGGEVLLVATTCPGQVTGMLPYSRMTHYPRYTVAVETSEVLRIRKQDFPEMLAVSHEVGQRLVAEMSDRVRGDVRLEQQRDRMAALGRLSAGLAHELNNPAAAIRRAAAGLAEELSGLATLVSDLVRHEITADQAAAINRLYDVAGERRGVELSPLRRSQIEGELGTWLEERHISRAWEFAATFADAGVATEDLTRWADEIPESLQARALAWTACRLSIHGIVGEITSSSDRIAQLVGSVKTYSHMDRSPEHKPTDVREGIDNTLTLLGHKIKKKQITLSRHYEDMLPLVSANAGELNQVWTNLIDNAIDAVEEAGTIRLEARRDHSVVAVDIVDNGQGIPNDIRSRIFEPFFTTKSVGNGTGLGLDIAMRIVRNHRGSLTITSAPGRTTARVQLPVSTDNP